MKEFTREVIEQLSSLMTDGDTVEIYENATIYNDSHHHVLYINTNKTPIVLCAEISDLAIEELKLDANAAAKLIKEVIYDKRLDEMRKLNHLIVDYDRVRPQLRIRLTSALEKSYLERHVTIKHLDVIDGILCFKDPLDKNAEIAVSKDLLKLWGLTEEDVINDAMNNMNKMFRGNLFTQIKDIIYKNHIAYNIEHNYGYHMYPITGNLKHSQGAVLLNPDNFKVMGRDCWIIASECAVMALPCSLYYRREVEQYVHEINKDDKNGKLLCDYIFKYNYKENTIEAIHVFFNFND